MDNLYFSERDAGPRPPLSDEIDETVWFGIVALLRRRAADGSFAGAFPVPCNDVGRGVIATDDNAFWAALRADVPDLPTSFQREVPTSAVAMDVLEFAVRRSPHRRGIGS